MEIIAQYGHIFLLLGCLVGFFMAWGIGANDVANAMGTSVGSRALTIAQAVLVACIFEFAGAYLAGGEVTSTIRKEIIEIGVLSDTPELLVYGMTAALMAAAIWLLIASYFGWPVSTTHSIVGAIVGFSAVGIGVEVVNWGEVASIIASWVVSPVLAGTISFLLFTSVRRLILQSDDPFMSAKRYVPFYMFLAGFTVSMVTFIKGLKHLDLSFTASESVAWSLVFALVIALLGALLLQRIDDSVKEKNGAMFNGVERVFAVLMIFTACAMAFAHGSNDVANAIGPLAAIVSVVQNGGEVLAESKLPPWILLIGASGIVIGLVMLGYRVMKTVGTAITELTPSRGFAAELAAAGTVVIASGIGLPISTTHTLVGAVLGVGLARGIGAINLGVVGKIIVSWIITLPVGAGLSILFFFALKGAFG
ncbi:MAG TPA: inorganic phosphate transporter [Gammaproteobacteria bacterium]|jgi:PiT family inorganic phosphate transporter|nr:phosphate permease [Gammaproteobacteria bacterium]MBQ08780.1 phosphate permease [Gammaproteobacteria bacterium]HJL79977.1 inorganic phosphate transporter [Gammaproteobacteria bacterium]HJN00812.1 inorganic phosphate transporter [Gammaproteobacteria bacterium]|tara:strand:+ start:6200 stop:7465 length:1266 start_codon:yes stop_codon:yes gene_type:complete